MSFNTKFTVFLVLLFWILLLALQFLRPDVDFYSDFISNFGVGNFSQIFSLAVLSLATGKVFLLRNTILSDLNSRLISAIKIFLAISIIATTLVAFYPVDTVQTTTNGIIHNVSAAISFGATAIFLLLFLKISGNVRLISKAKVASTTLYILSLICTIFVPTELLGLLERFWVLFLGFGIIFSSLDLNTKLKLTKATD